MSFGGTGIILSNSPSIGVKVDADTPDWTWHDIIGDVRPKTTGAGTPALTLYKGTNYGYAFVANDVCDFVFHIPHDYVPGTHLYLHTHHGHNGTNISGNAVWTYYIIYGSRDGVYGTEVTGTISFATPNLTAAPQYGQMVTEEQVSAATATAARFDSDLIEVDGLIKVRLMLTTVPTVTGGSWFLDTADIHYQSTSIGTKNRAAPFYT